MLLLCKYVLVHVQLKYVFIHTYKAKSQSTTYLNPQDLIYPCVGNELYMGKKKYALT